MKEATVINEFRKLNKRIDELTFSLSHNIMNNQNIVLTLSAIQDILVNKNILTKEEVIDAIKSQAEKFKEENKNAK